MLEGCHSWPDELCSLYREKGYWEDRTIPEVIEAAISNNSAKTALVFPDERVSYQAVGQMSNRLAHHFVALGIRPRDRVVFQLDSKVFFIPTFLAMLKIGAIPVLALPSHRDHEIEHFIAFSGATAYVIPDEINGFDFREMATRMQSKGGSLKTVLVAGEVSGDHISIPKLLQEAAPGEGQDGLLDHLQSAPDDVALMLLSGGTTAIPKLIPRTHNDYVYNFKQSGAVAGFDTSTVFLAVLPLAHNYTLASPGVLSVLELGGQVVFSPSNKPEDVFPCVERHKVTNINAAVPLFNLWLNSDIPAKHDLSSLRAVMNGGARLAPKLRRRAEATFGCRFLESFGTGEGLLMQTRLDDSDDIRMNSSGKPVSPGDEIKVVDEAGNELPDGETGELLVRGPYTIRGYYNSPENDKKAFTTDGYYRMGDTVYQVDGYIYAEGRKKDLINRGGEKISVEEVENLIFAHPSVQGVAIVAMPDPVFGEKACAYVKLCSDTQLNFEQLQDFLLKSKIAKFKLPERLEIIDEFPISPAGKILRKELRERISKVISMESSEGK
ncbi:MAG: AMP-binding protein [Rhodobacteraceae bacterium]|nr:AMP-binding protein [Paracoccaceae bacterium]